MLPVTRRTGMRRAETRHRARRLRSGALTLTLAAFIPLAIGGSASASTIAGAGNNLGSPQGNEVDNLASATAVTNGKTVFNVKFGLGAPDGPVVTAVNRAVALTSHCAKCNAIAIGFQVVTTTTQDLVDLRATNVANATNDDCSITCDAVADAYQVVVATDTPRALTYGQLLSPQQLIALYNLRSEFLALPNSGLTLTQIQAKCDDLANQAVTILNDADYGGPSYGPVSYTALALPTFVPAVQGAGAAGGTSHPLVTLYRNIKSDPFSG